MKLAIIFIAGVLWAEDKPPVIPADLQTEVALTQLDLAEANAQAAKMLAVAQQSMAKAQAACGEKYIVQRQGNALVCATKPEAK